MRPCLVCGTPTQGSRCSAHRLRRTTTQEGYGYDHQAVRKQVLRQAGADQGGIGGWCAICGGPGTPRDPLQAGHILSLNQGGASTRDNEQAEHRSCNLSKRHHRTG